MNRGDVKKNVKKVATSLIKKPLQTEREIAKDTGLSKTTVHSHLKRLPKLTKSDQIIKIVERDLEIVKRGQEIINNKLNDEEQVKKMKITDVSQVIKENTTRYTLFKGETTDNEGGLKIQRQND